jgi:predicted esterase
MVELSPISSALRVRIVLLALRQLLDFHPMLDPLLRQGKGKTTPLLVVHGGKDPIFPIASIRQAWTLFQRLGYNVTAHELPEWGHAYPYTINEQIVLPWFADL